jgi:hypothetical protein
MVRLVGYTHATPPEVPMLARMDVRVLCMVCVVSRAKSDHLHRGGREVGEVNSQPGHAV